MQANVKAYADSVPYPGPSGRLEIHFHKVDAAEQSRPSVI
jgi:hypothetical protein